MQKKGEFCPEELEVFNYKVIMGHAGEEMRRDPGKWRDLHLEVSLLDKFKEWKLQSRTTLAVIHGHDSDRFGILKILQKLA